jgi:hypothetical protein
MYTAATVQALLAAACSKAQLPVPDVAAADVQSRGTIVADAVVRRY